LRQKDLLQNISTHSNNNIDFGDIIETYSLLVREIERLQQELHLKIDVFEEEEEEVFGGKYRIESVIEEEHGKLRPVRHEDFLIHNNKNVEKAFKVIANWHKQYKLTRDYNSEREPDGSCFANIFVLRDQALFNKTVLQMTGKRCA